MENTQAKREMHSYRSDRQFHFSIRQEKRKKKLFQQFNEATPGVAWLPEKPAMHKQTEALHISLEEGCVTVSCSTHPEQHTHTLCVVMSIRLPCQILIKAQNHTIISEMRKGPHPDVFFLILYCNN